MPVRRNAEAPRQAVIDGAIRFLFEKRFRLGDASELRSMLTRQFPDITLAETARALTALTAYFEAEKIERSRPQNRHQRRVAAHARSRA